MEDQFPRSHSTVAGFETPVREKIYNLLTICVFEPISREEVMLDWGGEVEIPATSASLWDLRCLRKKIT